MDFTVFMLVKVVFFLGLVSKHFDWRLVQPLQQSAHKVVCVFLT